MQMLRIRQILEDDFGCEERADDAPEMLLLLLEAEDGTRRWLRMEASLVDARALHAGDAVRLTDDGSAEKR